MWEEKYSFKVQEGAGKTPGGHAGKGIKDHHPSPERQNWRGNSEKIIPLNSN